MIKLNSLSLCYCKCKNNAWCPLCANLLPRQPSRHMVSSFLSPNSCAAVVCENTLPTLRNRLSGICTAGMYSRQFHEVDCVKGTRKAFTQNVLLRWERERKNTRRSKQPRSNCLSQLTYVLVLTHSGDGDNFFGLQH